MKTYPTRIARGVDASRIRFLAQALLIVCIAIAIRAYDIGRQSLWTDELFSRYYPDLFSLKFLWTTGLLHENSPPLYYMAIEGWMRAFGTSETAIRSLSLVASVLTLPLIYLIGTELLDRRRGLLAALIFALSPMSIDFAQEARTYALLLIPIAVALLAIARFLRGDMRPRVLWCYGVGATVALYCHATAVFFIAACNVVVVAAILTDLRLDRRIALARWLLANAVVGLLAVPELVAMIVLGHTAAGIGWIPPFRPVDVIRALSPVVVGTATPDRFPGAELSLLLVAVLAVALRVAHPARRVWIVLVAIPGVFVVLIAIASLYHSIFIARVFCWLTIPPSLLLAHALIAPRKLRPALAAVVVVVCATGLAYRFMAPQKEPWREVLNQIGPQLARADDVVIAPLTDPTPLAYYAPYVTDVQKWDVGPSATIENGALPRSMGVRKITRQRLVDDIRSGANVWLILRTPDLPNVEHLLVDVPPPKRFVERSCGKVVCIAALSWSAVTIQ